MKTLLVSILLLSTTSLFAQIDARLMHQPDVSESHIVFSYANNLWLVPKEGGQALQLTTADGEEYHPKFSPDGSHIAFSGNYQGNYDVYKMSIQGALPQRLTYHGYSDRVLGWHPNGEQVLFASSRKSGKMRWRQFYLSNEEGLPTKLPIEHGEYGSLSEDGKTIAFTDKSRVSRNWKRYRGGTAPDIWVMNLEDQSAEKIAKNDANDELPMIKGDLIYFLSDRGPAKRNNLWVFNQTDKSLKQLTFFQEYDMHYPSMGPSDIVFEAAGKLHLFNLKTEKTNEIKVTLVSDQKALMPQLVNTEDYLSDISIAHDAKRLVVEARGDVYTVPVKEGVTKNLTQTSGSYERTPSWSPNGEKIAYWSDASGEYQLVIYNTTDQSETTYTDFNDGFRYNLFWSPDSKKLVFIEQTMEVKLLNIESKKVSTIDQLKFQFHGGLSSFSCSWDPNSEWITYTKDTEKRTGRIALYHPKTEKLHEVTSGFYNDGNPSFDPSGKYLYFTTNRHFSPSYSEFDNTFIYDQSAQIAVVPLLKETPSPFEMKNDEVSIDTDDDESDADDEKEEDKEQSTQIDLEGFEQRMDVFPLPHGNYGSILPLEDKIVFSQNTGDGWSLTYFDLKEKESKTIISNISLFSFAPSAQKVLVRSQGQLGLVNIAEGQSVKETIALSNLQANIVPKEEWMQIYRDAWRLERDFFYDKNMHGLDWQGVYDQYLPLLKQANTRNDVNFVLGEMIGEMNASHTYKGGGDIDYAKSMNIGYLGCDYAYNDGKYQIAHIVDGSPWNNEVRSPLNSKSVYLNEGDYLLSINGIELSENMSPYAALQNQAGKTVELLVSPSGKKSDAKSIIVEAMRDEYRLRHLEWIEQRRLRVEEATNGKAGYIYVPSTGIDGQNELVRQFYGQWDKEALIIDERFNNGGQIPDRFVELLNRKPLAYFAVRDGQDWQWPPVGHFGPKVMLINGWSGSGGDAFPDYFRKSGLGELIGTRTWGGLIGISGAPQLIDGGGVTVPTFRMYDPGTGDWFKEGHGVEPDIEVDEDASALSKGTDPQLEKAIEVILEKLNTEAYKKPNHEGFEVR